MAEAVSTAGRTLWQGKLDALCGIYCAAHIIAEKAEGNYNDQSRIAFSNLLQSAEEKELLTAKKIGLGTGNGFYDHELVAIFNGLTARKAKGLRAKAFTSDWFKSLKNLQRRNLIRDGASAIVQEHGKSHWIAVTQLQEDGTYLCFDPSLENTTETRKKIRWARGALIATPDTIGTENA